MKWYEIVAKDLGDKTWEYRCLFSDLCSRRFCMLILKKNTEKFLKEN